MYLWVVLATFLAVIAGYYLPIRQDTHDIINMPVAQASLIQMIAQHKIAKKWIVGESFPMTCYCVIGACNSSSAIGQFCGATHNNCQCTTSLMSSQDIGKFPYPSGQNLSKDMLTPYAPPGFMHNNNYKTVLYCAQDSCTGENCTEYENTFAAGSTGSCDTGAAKRTVRLLITTGPIPEKWLDYDENNNFIPSTDFMNAMRTEFFSSEKAGYAVNKQEIINHHGGTFEIPSSGPQNEVQSCLNTYGTCLVQMSIM